MLNEHLLAEYIINVESKSKMIQQLHVNKNIIMSSFKSSRDKV